jgi:hypothetical protein
LCVLMELGVNSGTVYDGCRVIAFSGAVEWRRGGCSHGSVYGGRGGRHIAGLDSNPRKCSGFRVGWVFRRVDELAEDCLVVATRKGSELGLDRIGLVSVGIS